MRLLPIHILTFRRPAYGPCWSNDGGGVLVGRQTDSFVPVLQLLETRYDCNFL